MAHYIEEGMVSVGLKASGEDVFTPAYRMPAKRSDRVIDNWREPFLIVFDRLNICDTHEFLSYLAIQLLRSPWRRPEPLLAHTDTKEVEALIEREIAGFKQQISPDFIENLPYFTEQHLKNAKDLTRKVLTMLAAHQYDPLITNRVTSTLHELHGTPSIVFTPQGTIEMGWHFDMGYAFEDPSKLTPDAAATRQTYITELKIIGSLFNAVWEHRRLYKNPDAKSDFAFCPVCDRVFERTRSDRRYCSITCSNVNKSHNRAIKQKDSHSTPIKS